jgi:ribose/xylose/arabinose/galactoside ABC-type transport system permease subunit
LILNIFAKSRCHYPRASPTRPAKTIPRNLSLWNPEQWFNWYTFVSISGYTAILGRLAIGQTFVILIREIDLSVGSVYEVVGVAFLGLEQRKRLSIRTCSSHAFFAGLCGC